MGLPELLRRPDRKAVRRAVTALPWSTRSYRQDQPTGDDWCLRVQAEPRPGWDAGFGARRPTSRVDGTGR